MVNTWYEDYWQHDTRVPVLNTATHRVSFEWPETAYSVQGRLLKDCSLSDLQTEAEAGRALKASGWVGSFCKLAALDAEIARRAPILDTLHQPPLFLLDESISPIGRQKPPYEWATIAVLVLGGVGMVAFWAWWGR